MTNPKQLIVATAAVVCLLSASVGYSHTRWNPDGELKPRQNPDGSYPTDVKTGPCGNLPRSENPVELIAGSTITVEFQSNIYHQGFFRIAFSEANDEGFDDNVLIDDIPDNPNELDRSVEITLPDVTCDACTLQLIQSMLDRSPPTDYFSCTDIRLIASEPVATPAPDAPTNFSATQNGEAVNLSWESSNSVVVFESETATVPAPQIGQAFSLGDTLDDATVVYIGNETTATLTKTPNDQTLTYSAFAYTEDFTYSAASQTDIVLAAISTPTPEEEEPAEETPTEETSEEVVTEEPAVEQSSSSSSTGGSLNLLFILGLLILLPARFLVRSK